jgi:glutathione S-transferase
MKIYGDRNSGNCLKVKWVCDHLAIPYAWTDVDTAKGGSRTVEFLQINPFGQVPTVVFDDGQALAQSNAIIRYLARGSALIPAAAFEAARMEAWMYWEQNSHEPYVAVARFQMVYLGRAASELDPNLVKRGYGALDQLEQRLRVARFLLGEAFSLADVALLAYTRLAHEGGFDLARYQAVQRWIGDSEHKLDLPPAR